MLTKLVLGTLAGVFSVVAVAYFAQRRLLYFPDRARVDPTSIGLAAVMEYAISAPDGAVIVSWWGKARPRQPTLLYFHGNGGALVDRKPRIERYMAEGWGIFMMAYRSYGGSTGSPTEPDNVADGIRAFDALVAGGVRAGDIVVYGESLGTGVATQVAVARPDAAGLILDAPYTSTADVGALRYPFLPVQRAMHDKYETKHHILKMTRPLLVLHGTLDEVIPVAMGREVARLAREPKTFVEFPSGGHSDLYINGNTALDHVRAFIGRLGFPRA
jgi:uncharacterized protein